MVDQLLGLDHVEDITGYDVANDGEEGVNLAHVVIGRGGGPSCGGGVLSGVG